MKAPLNVNILIQHALDLTITWAVTRMPTEPPCHIHACQAGKRRKSAPLEVGPKPVTGREESPSRRRLLSASRSRTAACSWSSRRRCSSADVEADDVSADVALPGAVVAPPLRPAPPCMPSSRSCRGGNFCHWSLNFFPQFPTPQLPTASFLASVIAQSLPLVPHKIATASQVQTPAFSVSYRKYSRN